MRLRNLGATKEEIGRTLAGDDVIADARTRSTMATTIDAPRWAVWAWLVQMGYRRGGWYSYDRIDNAGVPSAEKIRRDWQHLAVGDRMPSRADGKGWFDVVVVEPERALVLRASLTYRALARTTRATVARAGSAIARGRSCWTGMSSAARV